VSVIARNYQLVTEAVGQAAKRSGRRPEDIKIICAAKTKSAKSVRAAIVAGATHIGENYVQEAARKIPSINDTATWHLIGHLQRNKAKTAVQLFDLIHSLDRLSLATELDRHGKAQGKIVHVLIQVNIASEQSRTGILPEEIEKFLSALSGLSNIHVDGLMTMPPASADPIQTRSCFKRLTRLKKTLTNNDSSNVCLRELSMGMSKDFTMAVEEGATIVRVGTRIFGERTEHC